MDLLSAKEILVLSYMIFVWQAADAGQKLEALLKFLNARFTDSAVSAPNDTFWSGNKQTLLNLYSEYKVQ